MENINMNINPDDLQDVKCEECEGEFFTPSFMIKKLSALQSPSGQKMFVPVQLFRCDSCGLPINPNDN